ncbi:hypothetical protein Drorol1_Dr00021159 [Drosera rotundifolia]
MVDHGGRIHRWRGTSNGSDSSLVVGFVVGGRIRGRKWVGERRWGRRRAELFVECALYIDGTPFGLESGQTFSWNELITLSTKYRDLTAQSHLAFTVWDVSRGKDEGLVGGATILLFNNKKQLRTGKQKL